MVNKINRLILIFLIVGISLYVVILNRENITIRLTPSGSITTNGGVVFILVFAAGFLLAGLLGLFFGIRTYLRERRYEAREKERDSFYQAMLKARGFTSAGDWEKAQAEWEKIIKRDPSNIIARVELSRTLEGNGEIREALRVLDAARSEDPHNIEVLFRAAELNLSLDNKTAAIDNLALALSEYGSRKAAVQARDLSEELGRFEDASEYQKQLQRLGADQTNAEEVNARLEYKTLLQECGSDKVKLAEKLRAFVKRHPNYAHGLEKLAGLERDGKKIDAAAQLLVRAAKVTGAIHYWAEAKKLWLAHGMPDRALAAARSAAKETSGFPRIQAGLNLIRLYLALNMFEDAKRALLEFPDLLKEQDIKPTRDILQSVLILKGLCHNSLGENHEAGEIWKKLSDQDLSLGQVSFEAPLSSNGEAPSPTLSTP